MTTMIQAYPPVHRRTAVVPVVVYGYRWCGITQMLRRALDRAGIDYDYVDLDADPTAERRLQWMAGGVVRTPVVYVGGEWLMAPSTRQLQAALARHGAW